MNQFAKTTGTVAFTLIELLVAVSIFLMIMAMVGAAYTRCTAVSEKSLAILDLHQRANAYVSYLDEDFSTLLPVSAMNYDQSDDNNDATIANIIFMRSTEGGFNRNYPDPETQARRSDTQWVCWHWDHEQGRIYRAESRAIKANWTDKFSLKHSLAEGGADLSQYGINPTAQRYFRNFIGSTNSIVTSTSNVSGERAQIYRRNVRNDGHPQKAELINRLDLDGDGRVNGWGLQWRTPYFDFLYKTPTVDPKKNIREKYFFGTDGVLNNGFAVANVDGQTYNKDFVTLLGDARSNGGSIAFPQNLADGSTISYQHQMKLVGEMVEFLTLIPVLADGESPLATAQDDDTNLAGIAVDAVPVDAREMRSNMPRFIHAHFVLHNVTPDILDYEDIDGDNDYDESFVQACRDQAIASVSTGSFAEKMRDRRQEFIRLIRSMDYFANEFSHVSLLTR